MTELPPPADNSGPDREPERDLPSETFREIGSATSTIEEASRSLVEGVKFNMTTIDREVRDKILDTISGLQQLNYADHAALLGLLNTWRDENSFDDLRVDIEGIAADPRYSNDLKGVLWNFLEIRDAVARGGGEDLTDVNMVSRVLRSGQSGLSNEAVAEDFLLIARSVFPFGVNMLNPEWRDASSQADHLSADQNIQIYLGSPERSGSFIVHPCSSDRSKTEVLYVDKRDKAGVPELLESGDGVVFGRRLEMVQLFGKMPDRGWSLASIPAIDNRVSRNWSRAGVMVVRQEDRVYLFDRGSRSKLNFNIDQLAAGAYEPKPATLDDGTIGFGNSSIERPKRSSSSS
ncbi:hypothetical protein OAO01_02800 [Oligoflexia bacterium]|nr:hypothetical protein [Oligoflexia bacterium]